MNVRRLLSLTALLTFLVTILTSAILYIAPQGRVAYWANWQILMLSREQWVAMHVTIGILFTLACLGHLFYNWSAIITYLKNSAKKLRIFTVEFTAALALTAICMIGTYYDAPPFSTILRLGDSFKAHAARKYGEPPYGHAELSSLKGFANKMRIDAQTSIKALRNAGFKVEDETQTLKEIAEMNNVSPQRIYQAMSADAKKPATSLNKPALPNNPGHGLGKLSMEQFCTQYGLDLKTVVTALQSAGLKAQADMRIKDIADANNMAPHDLYERILILTDRQAED